MIETFKVTVVGEKVSFYVESKYRGFLIDFLGNLDCITIPVNHKKVVSDFRISRLIKKKDAVQEPIPRELGGCVRCGKPRRKNTRTKLYCTKCKKENREKRI